MGLIIVKKSKKKVLISFGALIISFGIFQMILGSLINIKIYRFIIIFFSLFLFFQMKIEVRLKSYYIFFLNVIIFLLSYLFSFNYYLNPFSDLQQIFWWVPFSVTLVSILKSKKELLFFTLKLINYIVILGSIISFVSFKKFMDLKNGIYWDYLATTSGSIIGGTSLNEDYNIYAFGISFIIIALKYKFELSNKKHLKLLWILLMILNFYLMLFSGSRRGLLLILALIIILPTIKFSEANLKRRTFLFRPKILAGIAIFPFIFAKIIEFFQTINVSNSAASSIINRLSTTQNFINSENNRTQRWIYALETFKNYDLTQFFFGDGFNYLQSFANEFNVYGEDHPHNFFLSTLLYSGVIGSIFLVYMIWHILVKLPKLNISFFFILGFINLLVIQLTSSNSYFSLNLIIFMTIFLLHFISNKRYLYD